MAASPSAPAAAEAQTWRAIAVCGCGHDGRLGVGDGAPSALSEIALLDDFIATSAHDMGVVQQVACGAYHTLVRTSTGLYGWGLHEDGQLGLGRPSSASTAAPTDAPAMHVPVHVTRPRRIALEEVMSASASAEDTSVRVLAVYCGSDHSVVHTSGGVYVTGRNDCGQLGLGHTDPVYTWAPLCPAAAASLPAGSAATLAAPPRARDVASTGQRPQLLHGSLTHVSCGTHHTLLAWRDALVVRNASPSAPDGAAGGAASAELELVRYPALLMACGRGDFGELGYDGDAWSVLQAKAQRQERALLHQLQRQAATAAAALTSASADGADDSGMALQGGTYKFKWKAAAAVKQRRPPFNSPFFEVVPVEQLEAAAVVLQRGALAGPDVQAALLGTHLPAGLVDRYATTATSSSSDSGGIVDACRSEAGASAAWEVASLHAMQHHSAVVLLQRRTCEDCNAGVVPAAADPIVLHWGCYYCSEIEDAASSQPRDVFADLPCPEGDRGVTPMLRHGLGAHAGDEVLLRYGEPWAAPSRRLDVLGSGNLGLGSDDSFERSWAPLRCGGPVAAPLSVQSVSGRSHYLLMGREESATGEGASAASAHEAATCVFGFGDNLHGQVGHSPALAPSTTVAGCEGDAITAPRPLLRCGDVLRAASVAVRVAQTGAAVTSTASVAHASSSAALRRRSGGGGADAPAAPSPAACEVVAIHAAMAGARHSVFVVDVQPARADP